MDKGLFRQVLAIILIACICPPLFANEIELIPVSIRNGLESQISLKWPLSDPDRIYSSETYLTNQKYAKKVGFDLSEKLEKNGLLAYNPETTDIMVLFYNLVKAPKCERGYVIQKVRLDKYFLNQANQIIKEKHEYLVEAMKLNNNKMIKRADEHLKFYSLQNSFKRKVVLESEIGCGQISGVAEGIKWPFAANRLYKRIQNYSASPGYYDRVFFESSQKYRMEFEFDAYGNNNAIWPEFMH